MAQSKKLVGVSISFSPNIGGTETHYDDLLKVLNTKGWRVWWLSYKPITVDLPAPFKEVRGKATIYRIPWPRHLFYKLLKRPIFEFLYLFPGLFVGLPILLLTKAKEAKTIHAQGIIAGAASLFWGRVFGKMVVISTHTVFRFPKSWFNLTFVRWLLGSADYSLGLSQKAADEMKKEGIPSQKVGKFTYWIDLERFYKIPDAKKKIGQDGKFIVFCASRLVPEKGIRELLKAASLWDKRINLLMAADGPLRREVQDYQRRFKNVVYVGKLTQEQLPLYYSAADLFIIPSTHEEGFGRVILESLACGTPVIGANRGAIPEAMDESVGKLIQITPENIKKVVEYYYLNRGELAKIAGNARPFAVRRYSAKNADQIIKYYN